MAGGPDDMGRTQRHRDEFEKEEEEELDELHDNYDDLISAGVENSEVAGAAEATRAHRGTAELEQNELDDMFDVIEQRDFVGAPPPGVDARDRSTADEDEESGGPRAAPNPADEEDEPIPLARPGDNWAGSADDLLSSPAPSEWVVSSSDWLKSE